MSAPPEPLYDEKAAARILSVSNRTVRRWRIEGLILHHRTPGGRVRYSLDQLTRPVIMGKVDLTKS